MPNHARECAVQHPPPIHQGGSDLPIKCRRFSNFEFLLEHCIGIVEKNISTKFGEYPTNCSEITTKKVLSVLLHRRRVGGIPSERMTIDRTHLSLKNF